MELFQIPYKTLLINGLIFNYTKNYFYKIWRIICIFIIVCYYEPQVSRLFILRKYLKLDIELIN